MNDEQLLRYSRQILLPGFDEDKQTSLLDAHVLIMGLGGLGSPVAMYLAAAGVGKLTLVDFDHVELSPVKIPPAESMLIDVSSTPLGASTATSPELGS